MRLSLDRLERLCRTQAVAIESGLDRLRGTEPAMLGDVPPEIARALRRDALAGQPLSFTFSQLGVMDELSLAILGAAEVRGDPARALTVIADRCADRRTQRNLLIQRLTYPVLLLVACILIPPLPRIVNGGVGAYLAAVAGPLVVLVVLGVLVRRIARARPQDPLRLAAIRVLSSLPIAGGIVLMEARARFTEVLGASVRAGLDMRASLVWACRAAAHARLGPAEPVIKAIEKGASLHEALATLSGLDATDRAMIAQGEMAGALDEVLPRIAKMHAETARMRLSMVVRVAAGMVMAIVMAIAAMSIVGGYMQHLRSIP